MGGIESSVCKCEEQYQQKVKTMSNIMTESCKKSIQETAIRTKEALMKKYGLKEKKKTNNSLPQNSKNNNSHTQNSKINNPLPQKSKINNLLPQNNNTNPPPQNNKTNKTNQNNKTTNPNQNNKTNLSPQITGGEKRTIRKRKKISNKSSKK